MFGCPSASVIEEDIQSTSEIIQSFRCFYALYVTKQLIFRMSHF